MSGTAQLIRLYHYHNIPLYLDTLLVGVAFRHLTLMPTAWLTEGSAGAGGAGVES